MKDYKSLALEARREVLDVPSCLMEHRLVSSINEENASGGLEGLHTEEGRTRPRLSQETVRKEKGGSRFQGEAEPLGEHGKQKTSFPMSGEVWRKVPLLWRDQTRVSGHGPHRGRRNTASQRAQREVHIDISFLKTEGIPRYFPYPMPQL